MSALREAAQQALEAWQSHQHGKCPLEKVVERITALRAALAQPDDWTRCHHCGQTMPPVPLGQSEPAQEPYAGDVTRIMREAGMTFHLGLPHKAVVEQMTRVIDLVYAEASIKAAQQFASALAQEQAEPSQEPVAVVRWDDIGHISWRALAMLSDGTPPYTAAPQRTMVPLTEDEVYRATKHHGVSKYTTINIARAIEKASWEKNYGQA